MDEDEDSTEDEDDADADEDIRDETIGGDDDAHDGNDAEERDDAIEADDEETEKEEDNEDEDATAHVEPTKDESDELEPGEIVDSQSSWQPPRPTTPCPARLEDAASEGEADELEAYEEDAQAHVPDSEIRTPEQLEADAEQLLRDIVHGAVTESSAPVEHTPLLLPAEDDDRLPSIVVSAPSPRPHSPQSDHHPGPAENEQTSSPKPRYTAEDIFGRSDDEDEDLFPKPPVPATVENPAPLQERRSPTPPAKAPTESIPFTDATEVRLSSYHCVSRSSDIY